ncbi:hypothetical protein GALMADRAFT_102529 [Galerina marginata CBS 339.88]|uniref:Ubiquitin 3 binding protein But2 C-terminal domain-containing protein n=1 Tax=Galerina marginata (strain CBS 339.88) TaxID=685588 RepID=A0A067SXR3_GALM3|nr:hypothetical protein GALMADRAFT_102529 [Galerina marginata CBS 339.88]
MKLFNLAGTVTVIASLAVGVASVVLPGADTPLFYLVASSSNAPSNLLPLRLNGGAGGYATLTGTAAIGKFYFYQGRLTAQDPAGITTYRPLIGSVLGSTGCSTYGSLGFVQGSSSDKCARYDGFQIQSNTENSQLGAMLVVNYVGGFYACGSGQDVWYKLAAGDGPTGCSPISLYTVPVVA